MKKVSKGFLSLAAAALLIVGAIVGLLVSHMLSTDSSSGKSDSDSTQAFYIASAGLERALHAVTTNRLSERVDCSSITNNANFTNAVIGNGSFTVSAVSTTISATNLTSAISSSATIIPVAALTGYVATGRFAIDDELIDYADTSTNSSVCAGNAPCFINIIRGTGGTTASAHASNSKIVQNRCALTSIGQVSGLESTVSGKRVVSVDIFQLEQGWLIGNTYNGNENILTWDGGGSTFAHWDGSSWLDVLPDADVPNKDIKSISCISSSDCWAVGSPQGGDSLIVHSDGSSWSRVTPDAEVPNSSLHAISCVNSHDCWAAGNNGTVIHWDGATWKNGDFGVIPSVTLNSIYILGTLDNDPLIANWVELA